MNIVLDTNVIVSGIFWRGYPEKVLSLWGEQKFQILVSEEILDEYVRVISSFGERTDKEETAEAWIQALLQETLFIQSFKKFQICRDPDDNKYLDCAVSGKAKFIVTGDKDLLCLKNIMNVDIVPPRKFLSLI